MSSSTAENGTKKITLRTSDGEFFEVEEAVAVQSQTIKVMIRDDGVDNVIPLPDNVTGKILSKVIEYCKRHVDATDDKLASAAEDLKAFDSDFVKVDLATLLDLIRAATVLDIKSLLDLTRENFLKGDTPEEIQQTFHIRNHFLLEAKGEAVTVADMIKGKTPDEIRKMFHITKEEVEKEVRSDKDGYFHRFVASYL